MTKDLALATFGAILGAAFGYAISDFKGSSVLSWSLVAALLVASFTTLALMGPLGKVLRPAGRTRLQGKWTQVWSYSKNGQDVRIEEELTVHQFGRFLKGMSRSVRVTGPFPFAAATARFRATVTDTGVIEGAWSNVDDGRNYRGVFTGVVSASGREVRVAWVGTENNGIRHGEAKWTRP